MNNNKIIVVYFSHSGENYSNGSIVNLEKGNTAVIAEKIAQQVNADVFEIVPVNNYSSTYRLCVDVARKELKADSRPGYKGDVDISEYQTVILGYPNWCGTMPMTVLTFLESHNFNGKTVMPYCTHEGSGMGNSELDLKRLVKGAVLKKGLPIHGSSVYQADAQVKKWLEKSL